MKDVQVIRDGKTFRVSIDGELKPVRDPWELKALTLDVRDRDRQFYERLMEAEKFRRAHEGSLTAEDLRDAIEAFLAAWLHKKHGTR